MAVATQTRTITVLVIDTDNTVSTQSIALNFPDDIAPIYPLLGNNIAAAITANYPNGLSVWFDQNHTTTGQPLNKIATALASPAFGAVQPVMGRAVVTNRDTSNDTLVNVTIEQINYVWQTVSRYLAA